MLAPRGVNQAEGRRPHRVSVLAVVSMKPTVQTALLVAASTRRQHRARLVSRAVVAIVHALAEAMNGRAWAESDGLGTRSTFAVSLPAA